MGELGYALFTLNRLEEVKVDLSDTQVQAKLRKVFVSRFEFLNEIGYK